MEDAEVTLFGDVQGGAQALPPHELVQLYYIINFKPGLIIVDQGTSPVAREGVNGGFDGHSLSPALQGREVNRSKPSTAERQRRCPPLLD